MTRLAILLVLFATTSVTKTRIAELASMFHDSVSVQQGTTFLTRTTADFKLSNIHEMRSGRAVEFRFSNGRASGVALDPTGTRVYFTRIDLWDIWVGPREDNGPAEPLPAPINTPAFECCAVVAKNGDVWFSSNRAGSWDIYVARGGEVTRIDALSTGAVTGKPLPSGRDGEWPGYIDPAGRFILFSSTREGGLGGDDIWYAMSDGRGGWQPPRNAGPLVNTSGYEDGPTVRGDELLWSSRAEGGVSDVYRIPLKSVVR